MEGEVKMAVLRRGKMPEQVSPMLCTLVKDVPLSDDYLFEVKWDGYRIIAYRHNGRVRLDSRGGLDYTAKYPLVAEALQELGHEMILDGEVVVFNKEGKPDFDAIQNYNGQRTPITYYVFDLLWLDGEDLKDEPLTRRKELLSTLLPEAGVVRVSESFGDGRALYEEMRRRNMEGVVAKQRDSAYLPGYRGTAWLKIPTRHRQEFVIGGWAESDKGRSFRSLLLGAYDGGEFRWVGRSGGGYKEKEMPAILRRLKKLEIEHSPFVNKVLDTKGAVIHWTKPELVANFEFATWTKSGRIRKPATFLGLRIDKAAREVVLEVPQDERVKTKKARKAKEGEQDGAADKGEERGEDGLPGAARAEQRIAGSRKKFPYLNADSNWKKVDKAIEGKPVSAFEMDNCTVLLHDIERELWEGVPKGRLVLYYNEIASFLLPHIKDRPQSLNLKLTTAGGPTAFIKDMENRQPDCASIFADERRVKKRGKRSRIDYLICNNRETLLYMIDYGCVDINPWASRKSAPENPDYLWIDLDPTVTKGDSASEDKGFEMALETARAAKELFTKQRIKAFVKTSGKTGLHIYIPCSGIDFGDSRKIANHIADAIHEMVAGITTRSESIGGREGKVYIDANQNDYADTLAAPYSVRPYHQPLVSTPLDWKELKPGLNRYDFHIETIMRRLEKKGDIFLPVLDPEIAQLNAKKLGRL